MRKRFHLDDIFSRETGFVQKVTGKGTEGKIGKHKGEERRN